MGNVCEKTNMTMGFVDTYEKIDIRQFVRVHQQTDDSKQKQENVVGIGGFAVVYQVRKKGDNYTDYAMKTMSKLLVSQQKNIEPTLNEMFLLRDIQHPFLIDMKWAFCDNTSLYLVMKLLKGKDLRFHINHFKLREDQDLLKLYRDVDRKRTLLESALATAVTSDQPIMPIVITNQKDKRQIEQSSFTENQARFIIAQMCLALNYLHHKNIIHRDIKPENVLFEEDGYLRIIDLGIAKKYQLHNSSDTSGTPGYMAPEVLCRQNHNFSVDYYAIGVMTYEMMLNKRPYEHDDWIERKDFNYRNELIKNILHYQIVVQQYNKDKIDKMEEKLIENKLHLLVQAPKEWSANGIDFVNKCLKRKPIDRIGYSNVDEVLQHPWFNGIDFASLLGKKYTKIPFSRDQMARSLRRQKIVKTLDDEMGRIDKLLEQDRQKRAEVKRKQDRMLMIMLNANGGRGSGAGDLHYDGGAGAQDSESSQSRGNEIQQQQQQQNAAAPQLAVQNKQTPEEAALDALKLKSLQHCFKHYYFDRDRYVIEQEYLQNLRLPNLHHEKNSRGSGSSNSNIIVIPAAGPANGEAKKQMNHFTANAQSKATDVGGISGFSALELTAVDQKQQQQQQSFNYSPDQKNANQQNGFLKFPDIPGWQNTSQILFNRSFAVSVSSPGQSSSPVISKLNANSSDEPTTATTRSQTEKTEIDLDAWDEDSPKAKTLKIHLNPASKYPNFNNNNNNNAHNQKKGGGFPQSIRSYSQIPQNKFQ